MQKPRVDAAHPLELQLGAQQEAPVASQPEGPRSARARSVRTDQVAGFDPGAVQGQADPVARGAAKRHAAVQPRARCLGSSRALSFNQAARWVSTKEQHASHIITTIAEYFLTQKVKAVPASDAGYQEYLQSLALHHRVMRAAMKTKQTVDPESAAALRAAVQELGKLYPKK